MRNRILVAAAMTALAAVVGCKKDEPKPVPVSAPPAGSPGPVATPTKPATPAAAGGGAASTTRPAVGPNITIGGPTSGPAPMGAMPMPGTAHIPMPPTRPAARVPTTGPTTRRSPLDMNKDELNK